MIIGKKIIHRNEIDSTNDEARRLVERGFGEGTVVIAGSQTKGRGKPGSSWYSPDGQGVYLSVIVKPYVNPKDLFPLTLLGAKAVINTIHNVSGLSAIMKFPNDVRLHQKKICGVLVERIRPGFLIIGIGVNVNNPPGSLPADLEDKATSLKIESGRDYDLAKFIEILITELDREYLAYLSQI
jgi:BirA family biotin operon repressor/biotin-[acetyl-CoA-carboxylase] ligase